MIGTSVYKCVKVLRYAIWDNTSETIIVTQEDYEEMKKHAVEALPACVLSQLTISPELFAQWNMRIITHIAYYTNYCYIQSILPITVPYVILKGTSAAQYYPHPEYRAMGDIDIITRREDFNQAYQQLLKNGYQETKTLDREISFTKNGITIELHRYFSSLNDIDAAQYMDDLIFENINETHLLPDLVNGLVILEHLSKHLEGGIGLRQVIDWLMFVDKCLPDDKWPEFEDMVEKIGLKKLAVVATRMCEIHLGLPTREWSAGADYKICNQLMEYILNCGNFGNKKTTDEAISENVFAYASTPRMAFKLLQKQGITNWGLSQRYKILQPFAWMYQAIRYATRGLGRKNALSKLKSEYDSAKKRNAMFDTLGVRTSAKGNVIYKDGKYVKTFRS